MTVAPSGDLGRISGGRGCCFLKFPRKSSVIGTVFFDTSHSSSISVFSLQFTILDFSVTRRNYWSEEEYIATFTYFLFAGTSQTRDSDHRHQSGIPGQSGSSPTTCTTSNNPHPSGVNDVRFGEVSRTDRTRSHKICEQKCFRKS